MNKLLLMLCLLGSLRLSAQPAVSDGGTTLLRELEAQLYTGDPRSLRDLGTLLADPVQKRAAWAMLEDHTLFTPTEFDFGAPPDRERFLDFYYTHADALRYSTTINAYYLTPMEEQTAKFEAKFAKDLQPPDPVELLRGYETALQAAFKAGKWAEAGKLIGRIAALDSPEAYELLLLWGEAQKWKPRMPAAQRRLLLQLTDELVYHPTRPTLDFLLRLNTAQLLHQLEALPRLRKLTNVTPLVLLDSTQVAGYYTRLADSLGQMDALRQYGYAQLFTFSPHTFQYPVDYYGRILAVAERYPWSRHNAIQDLRKQQHPRALLYLAAQLYQYRGRPDPVLPPEAVVALLRELTGEVVAVEGAQGMSPLQDWGTDARARRNWLVFWASNYENFGWDEIRGSFVNKREIVELQENYERLFRRLNSPEDSVALRAYRTLTQGDPVEVAALAKKYKKLLRSYHPGLPPFKYAYLETLAALTAYVRQHGLRYRPTAQLALLLDRLSATRLPADRHRVEGQILDRLTIETVTAIEYWGLLRAPHTEDAFSVGRILDRFYSLHWDRVVHDDVQLRLYLKKAALFRRIGVIGVCNHYLQKFEPVDNHLVTELEHLIALEVDADILATAGELLNQEVTAGESALTPLLESRTPWNRQDIAELPGPTTADFRAIMRVLNGELTDKVQLANLWGYLLKHPVPELVPDLFVLLRAGSYEKKIVRYLEAVFNHRYDGKAADWLRQWEENAATVSRWEEQFFEANLTDLRKPGAQDIKQLNRVTQSRFYTPAHRALVLAALPRVQPAKHITRLKLTPRLSIVDQLTLLEGIAFDYKTLDNLPRIFDTDETAALPVLVDYLLAQAQAYTAKDRGSFYNNLFRLSWFADYVLDGGLAPAKATAMRQALQTYLDESELLSAFEEQYTVRNIALLDLLDKDLEARLAASLVLEADAESRGKLQEAVLARIAYDQLHETVPFLAELRTYNYWNQDFGLPIFDAHTLERQSELGRQLARLDERGLYEYYLDQFGVDYKDSKGKLDFFKIYRILQYDIVTPFVGDGGSKRDYYTYGIIKLLELHFGTRLGFHPKLNENQTFYRYSAAKRAEAWRLYLEDEGLVPFDTELVPSFNWLLEEEGEGF